MKGDPISDKAAERAVLAGIVRYGSDAYIEVSDQLTYLSFADDANKVIYRCMDHILHDDLKAIVDVPSILSAAKSLNLSEHFDKPSEVNYLRSVMNFPVELPNVRRFAGKVRRLEVASLLMRQLYLAGESVESISGDETIEHIFGLAEKPIFDLSSLLANASSGGPEAIGVGVRAYVQHLIDNPREYIGISTGFKRFDRAIGGGLRPRTVNLIGARIKVGKTYLCDAIAMNVADQDIPVLILDTEMAKEDHWNRMLACLSGVKIDRIENGKFASNPIEREAVERAVERLEKMPYTYLSIAGQPFEETIATMRRWVVKQVGIGEDGLAKPCVVFLDYLKLTSSESITKAMAEFQVLGFMMTALHNFMVKYGVACVAFVQLNRDGITREDSDVASGSDRIVWLCSNFTLFKAQSDEEMAEQLGSAVQYNRKLVPLLARHGPGMASGDFINVEARLDIGRITEGPTRNQLAAGQAAREFKVDGEVPETF